MNKIPGGCLFSILLWGWIKEIVGKRRGRGG